MTISSLSVSFTPEVNRHEMKTRPLGWDLHLTKISVRLSLTYRPNQGIFPQPGKFSIRWWNVLPKLLMQFAPCDVPRAGLGVLTRGVLCGSRRAGRQERKRGRMSLDQNGLVWVLDIKVLNHKPDLQDLPISLPVSNCSKANAVRKLSCAVRSQGIPPPPLSWASMT